jgi:tetratricopeptide (TPR) repeat protein
VLANDDDGNIVDVRLLMQAENYGKVVTLRTEFERNPTPEFAHLLSWAYLMQASALSGRAHAQTQPEAKRLLEQALQKIQSAIFIDQSSTEACKRLGSVLRDLGRPTEAVVAYDRALAIDQNDFEAWSDRAAPLINQNKLQDAIDSASNGLQHASEPREQAYVLATRAAAHHFAQHPKEAITDLLAAWELDPAMIVQSIGSHGLHEQIIVQEPSPQAVLLLAEMRWTKAAYAAANQRMEEANISANLAGETLETLIPMPAQESFFTGSLSSELIDDTLFRTAVRLQKLVGAEFAAPYIQRMQAWVVKVLGAESEGLARLVSES